MVRNVHYADWKQPRLVVTGPLQPNGAFNEGTETMVASTRKSAAVAIAAIGLSVGLAGAAKAVVLPVTNLTFNQFTNNFNGTKNLFGRQANRVVYWFGCNNNLIYVGNQGKETVASGGFMRSIMAPGFSNTVPAGTNFFQADGNPTFESTIFQTISGLTAGTDIQPAVPAGGRSANHLYRRHHGTVESVPWPGRDRYKLPGDQTMHCTVVKDLTQ